MTYRVEPGSALDDALKRMALASYMHQGMIPSPLIDPNNRGHMIALGTRSWVLSHYGPDRYDPAELDEAERANWYGGKA